MKKLLGLCTIFLIGIHFIGCKNEGDLLPFEQREIFLDDILYKSISDSTWEVIPLGIDTLWKKYEGDLTIPPSFAYYKIDGTYIKIFYVVGIGDSAFYGCDNLRSVSMPSTIQYVNKCAFSNCSMLSSIICKNLTPPHIDPTAFDSCDVSKITLYVFKASVVAYEQDSVWGKLLIEPYAFEDV